MPNEVRIEINTDASKAQKGFHDIRIEAGLLKAAFGNVGAVAGGFLVGRGLEQGLSTLRNSFTSVIHAAEEDQNATAQLNAVLASTGGTAGVTADQVESLSKALEHQTTFSDEAITSAQSLLLTFTDIKANILPQTTQAVLDVSTALHQDLQSSAIQIGKALQDPVLGLTALRRVGVSFTESQREMIKTLVESGDKLGAQKIILAELNKEFAGSAAASASTFEGRLKQLGNEFDDLKEKVGLAIIGGFMKLSDWFEAHKDDLVAFWEKMKPAVDEAVRFVETRIGGMIGMVKGIADGISHAIDLVSDVFHGRWASAWEDFKNIAVDIGKVLVNELAALFGTIPNLLIDAMNKAIDKIRDFQLPEIDTHVAGTIGGGNPFAGLPNIPHLNTQPFDAEGLFKSLEDAGKKASGAKPHFDALGDAMADAGDKTQKLIDAIGSAFGKLISGGSREMDLLQLQSDQLQLKIDMLSKPKEITKEDALANGITIGGNTSYARSYLEAHPEMVDSLVKQANTDLADGFKRDKDEIERHIKILQDQHKIDQDFFALANRGLLTEAQLKDTATALINLEGLATKPFISVNDILNNLLAPAIKDKLIPAFTDLNHVIDPGGVDSFPGLLKQSGNALNDHTTSVGNSRSAIESMTTASNDFVKWVSGLMSNWSGDPESEGPGGLTPSTGYAR